MGTNYQLLTKAQKSASSLQPEALRSGAKAHDRRAFIAGGNLAHRGGGHLPKAIPCSPTSAPGGGRQPQRA